MATLQNTKIKDTYPALLKADDNGIIGASEKVITDGLGNASVLSIGTASASFSSDIDINSVTIGRGSGDLGSNAVLGFNALDSNTTGASNTAIGSTALNANTTGSQNTALGKDALNVNTTGSYNVAVGHNSLDSNTTGQNNTAIGSSALQSNVDGIWNTALGYGAGYNKTGGDSNIYIGYQAIGGAVNSTNEIVIGKGATGNGSNTATYGNASITDHHFTSGTVRINSDYLRLTGATNPQVLVTDTTNSVSVGLQALDASTKIESTHSFKTSIANNIIHSVTSSGVEITGNLAVDTNTLYVDAANNRVGVGSTSPLSRLHIQSSDNLLAQFISNDALAYISFSDSSTTSNSSAALGANGDNLTFYTGTTFGSERMRIDSSGRVGIGTSSPATNLHISSTASTPTLRIESTHPSGIPFLDFKAAASSQIRYIDETGTIQTRIDFTDAGGIAFVNVAGGSERMRIDSSGNVGIGTNNPATKLEIGGASNTALTISKTGDLSTGLQIGRDSTTLDAFIIQRENADLFIRTNNTERMRIDSSGNVGIGESNPVTRLDIDGFITLRNAPYPSPTSGVLKDGFIGSDDGTLKFTINGASNGAYGSMAFITRKGDSSDPIEAMRIDSSGVVQVRNTTPTIQLYNTDDGLVSNQTLGDIDWYQIDPSDQGVGTVAKIRAVNRSSFSGVADLTFHTGNATTLSERMRITSGGDVLVGTTGTPDGTTNYGAGFITQSNERKQLRLASNTTGGLDLAQFYNPNGKVGSILTNGSATSFVTSSDYRLKENVVEMTGALDRVDALKPSRFNFIADPEKTVDGFLAHEVAEVVPEAVTGEKDAVDEEGNPIYQGIDQSKITPLLTAAIKELKALVEAQAEKIAILESKLNA